MSLTTKEEFRNKIKLSLGTLQSRIGPEQLAFSVDQALGELQWTLPISDAYMEFWALQRGKRHALDILRTEAAYKFKYKQINLQQRYEQLDKQIWKMDVDFKAALKDDPILLGIDPEKTFGTYLDNGFVYDQWGNDITRWMNDIGVDNEGYRERQI